MNLMRRVVVFSIITISTGFPVARSESKAEPKVEDLFKVSWSSVTYSKTVSVRNPAVSGGQGQDESEKLSLTCEVEIPDPNRILGICRQPLIEKITDGGGKSIEISSVSPGSGDMRYDLLRYRKRYVRTSPKLVNSVRSTLGLPRKVSSRPHWVKELESGRMQINLDVGLSKQAGGEIGRVKGYFHALVAESLEYVDVPFERSDNWVRLTPDLEIRVRDVSCQESRYSLTIEARPEAGGYAPPLSVQSYLPNKLVVTRQLLGPDDNPISHPTGIRCLPDSLSDESGAYSGSGIGQIKKIRFVIAVNPTHYKIPFVFEHIPLPKP